MFRPGHVVALWATLLLSVIAADGSSSGGDTVVTPTPTPTPTPTSPVPTATPELGAPRNVTVGPSHVEDLLMALADSAHYTNANIQPICVVEVKKVQIQVVSGLNYIFEVEGCGIPTASNATVECTDESCPKPGLYRLEVFVQGWSNLYEVHSITPLGP